MARSLRSFSFRSKQEGRRSPSPTFSDTTHASAMNFGNDGPEKIITRANLKASLAAFEELMTASAAYRAALLTISAATASFATALDTCSVMKGPSYEASTRMQAASGLHHLVGNHWHVLAETLDKNFEKPLRQHLDTYQTIVTERSASYEKALQEKSRIIRKTEMGNMNRKRNLQSFREALNVLQRQVDELDDLKVTHYQDIMLHEEEVWDVVQAKVCIAVRSTMDVFDKFTTKASDPVIEGMLQSVPDPFDAYGMPSQSDDQIFSILPPLSIMNTAVASPSPSPLSTTPERETIDGLPNLMGRRSSWVPNTGYFSEPTSEWADVASPSSTPPRSVSPTAVSPRGSPPTHNPRKSESKLRSMLAVIDETRPRQSDNSIPAKSLIPASDSSRSTTNWQQTFGPTTPPYAGSNGEETPRNSILFTQQEQPPLPEGDKAEPKDNPQPVPT